MRKHLLSILLFTFCSAICYGQNNDSAASETDPDKAKLIYTDVDNFWMAFDKTFQNYNGNAFADLYINVGTDGVKNFMDNERIVHADTLKKYVIANKAKYLSIRQKTSSLSSEEKHIRSTYYAFKYLYAASIFPPLYFVIGRFTTGGTAKPGYQIIGSEMNDPSNMVYIVAHELIHSNQHIPYKYRILLEQCIIEGSADFLGELISGKIANTAAYEYAIGKEEMLWNDFVNEMNFGENDSFSNWLYGGERKDKRPQDMGYYIGYMITKAYYDKATDKRKAIDEILNIKDCKQFLMESGYGANIGNSSATQQVPIADTATEVTFLCPSCTKNNKLKIVGATLKEFVNTTFPFSINLKVGDYRMIYSQNKVQQINLPFKVESNRKNNIKVK